MTTKIEWTDVSWNPVRGCSLVSAGCVNCYAMKQAHRFSGVGQPYEGLTEIGPHGPRWTGKIRLVHEALEEPLHWKKPRRIFVNSMSDLFHEDVPDEFIEKVFNVMANAQWIHGHQFQVLTKRPERMKRVLERIGNGIEEQRKGKVNEDGSRSYKMAFTFPLQNIWLGVSIEDQQTADERIPILLQTPAAVRFVSYEPALGPVDLTRIDGAALSAEFKGIHLDALRGGCKSETPWHLNWVIVGGESGPGARPCDLAWVRSIKEQCQAVGVPVFIKQIGSKPIASEVVFDADRGIDGQTVITVIPLNDKKGGDPAEWPADLRIREFPR